jgi:hypothetical protein
LFHTSSNTSPPASESPTPADCGSHPTKSLGRTLKRNANAPSTNQENKWMTIQNMKAIVKSVTLIPYPGYGQIITLEFGIFSNKSTNMITISNFPVCTCDHFVNMCAVALSSRKAWLYQYICKANAEDDKFIHAHTLSFEEVQELLHGTNL